MGEGLNGGVDEKRAEKAVALTGLPAASGRPASRPRPDVRLEKPSIRVVVHAPPKRIRADRNFSLPPVIRVVLRKYPYFGSKRGLRGPRRGLAGPDGLGPEFSGRGRVSAAGGCGGGSRSVKGSRAVSA